MRDIARHLFSTKTNALQLTRAAVSNSSFFLIPKFGSKQGTQSVQITVRASDAEEQTSLGLIKAYDCKISVQKHKLLLPRKMNMLQFLIKDAKVSPSEFE